MVLMIISMTTKNALLVNLLLYTTAKDLGFPCLSGEILRLPVPNTTLKSCGIPVGTAEQRQAGLSLLVSDYVTHSHCVTFPLV